MGIVLLGYGTQPTGSFETLVTEMHKLSYALSIASMVASEALTREPSVQASEAGPITPRVFSTDTVRSNEFAQKCSL
jgi:hypothetical protein